MYTYTHAPPHHLNQYMWINTSESMHMNQCSWINTCESEHLNQCTWTNTSGSKHMNRYIWIDKIWQFLICCFIQIAPQSAQWHWTPVRPKNIPEIYPRYIQDIQDKYKIPSGRRPGPARAKPGAAHGGRLVFCIYLGYLGYILDIFLVFFWYMFGI